MAGMSDLHAETEERAYISRLEGDACRAGHLWHALESIRDISKNEPIRSTAYNIHMYAHEVLKELA